MSRRRAAEPRKVLPDVKYGDITVVKFINCMMKDGKRSVAEKAFYGAISSVADKLSKPPLEVFNTILDNVKPMIEVRSRRVGGATYQVPVEVRASRSSALSIKWLIAAARARKSERTIEGRLSAEFMDAYHGKGSSVKKKEDTHKMAESNKAFAHYRW